MLKLLTGIAFTLASTAIAPAATCAGADPAIVSTSVKNVTQTGGLNHYTLTGTVTNLGRMKQASNVLQFVDIFSNGQKMDNIGIPPLKPGQSYTFNWTMDRSAEAGDGTTHVRFSLRSTNSNPTAAQDCNASNDTSRLTF